MTLILPALTWVAATPGWGFAASPTRPPRCAKADGIVFLEGIIYGTGDLLSKDVQFLVLPVGYRPGGQRYIRTHAYSNGDGDNTDFEDGYASVSTCDVVDETGNVTESYPGGPYTDYGVCFDGLSFNL